MLLLLRLLLAAPLSPVSWPRLLLAAPPPQLLVLLRASWRRLLVAAAALSLQAQASCWQTPLQQQQLGSPAVQQVS